MFTVCPKCALTLVVTAADLRVAQGYVRCGRCSSVFNALAQLSDERSATPVSESTGPPPEPEEEQKPQLASPEVVEESFELESAPPPAPVKEASRSAPPAAEDDESTPEYTLEFNPETTDAASLFVVAAPSPEWTAATGSFKELVTSDLKPEVSAPAPKAQEPDEDFEVELDAALLSDIVQAELVPEKPGVLAREPPAPAAPPLESAAASAAARHAVPSRPEAPAAANRPVTATSTPAAAAASPPAGAQPKTAAPATGRTAPATAASTAPATTARTPPASTTAKPPAAPTPGTASGPSSAAAAAAATAKPATAPAARTPPPPAGKTSPGATVKASTNALTATLATWVARTASAPAAKKPPAAPAKTASATETAAPPRGGRAADADSTALSGDVAFADLEAAAGAAAQSPARPQWQWAAGSVLLMLILFAQIINHQRDALATDPRFSPSLTAVYTALGVQLTPRWDLRAYDVRQLGASVAAGGTGAITVRASIRNVGSRPQPMPLLRVTLQDRFGNRLASRDVQPRDYLPSGTSPAALLARDQRVDAELAFVDPGASAVGFELDACLPLGGGIVCANDTSSPR